MKTLSMLLSILLFIYFNNLQADSPKLKEAIKITSMKVIGNPTKGNKIKLKVSFISNIDGEADITFFPSKNIVQQIGKADAKNDLCSISLKKGGDQEIVYNLIVEDIGESILPVYFIQVMDILKLITILRNFQQPPMNMVTI